MTSKSTEPPFKKKRISYLNLSDVHLGNKSTKTKWIIAGMDNMFQFYSHDSPFKEVDIIFIHGDLFDQAMMFNDPDTDVIILFLSRLMNYCHHYGIKLRILEGTPLHDRNQSKIAETVYKVLGKEFDFRYVRQLEIEFLKDLQAHILYVPDEWTSSHEKTFSQVRALMHQHGIDQVDIASMHGMFKYQAPVGVDSIETHREADYLPIVKHFINIGHHHTHSVHSDPTLSDATIIAQGSVDRLTHGQEEPKGMVLCTIDEAMGNHFEFFENTMATVYKTIKLTSNDFDKSIKKLDKEVAGLKAESRIRLLLSKTHPFYASMEEIEQRYPEFHFTRKDAKEENDERKAENVLNRFVFNHQPIHIDRNNIVGLVSDEVKRRLDNISVDDLKLLESRLEALNG